MRIYTLQARPGGPAEAPDLLLVKEGFSWPALLLGPVWFAWMRVWRWLILYLAVLAVSSLALAWIGAEEGLQTTLGLAIALFFGAQANDARRAALARRGYRFAGLVHGSLAVAEQRALAAWPPGQLVAGVP